MRIGFAGTPTFAAVALAAILEAGLAVSLVLTRPDRPHGRGMKLEPGPVKAMASARGLPVLQPAGLREHATRDRITATALDVLVVAAYGLILPKSILDWPRHGCINIHASLLPRWRGAAPIQRALLAGDRETGVSIMAIEEGLDTGPIIAREPVPIAELETAGSLHDKLALAGARAIVPVLRQLQRTGHLSAQPQPESGVTYAAKIDRAEARIDWQESAPVIERRVRAFDPTPGARTTLAGEAVKLWEAAAVSSSHGAPGTVLQADATGILVACGEGALNLTALQRAGGRRVSAAAFLAGYPLATGMQLGGANG
jgi:methionyl-tRNA formyltransferase